jgi:EAL domain-containing protein (putative c-di-GMP-specific phosphodiesterase class I)
MVARLEATLRATPAAAHTRVEGAQLMLDSGPIPQGQAARTLRYALGRFAEGHTSAAEAAGDGAGLAGILASAERHTHALRAALNERRFRLLYQPVVSLADRTIHHYEALLRPIATPNMPMKETQEFVLFAEAVGLSEELDWAVLEMAIDALHASPGAAIAVNMSGLSMQNLEYRRRLLSRIGELRSESGRLAPNRLMIELTETAEIQDMDAAASTMEQLRSVGIPVCLDDFGAGSAAFRYLRAFGVDYVKIDGAYVRAAGTRARDRQLVSSMVELAVGSGARVVAEMIETEAEAQLMQDLGVTYGQGWLFGKPGRLPGTG